MDAQPTPPTPDERKERFGYIQGVPQVPVSRPYDDPETWDAHMKSCGFCQTIAMGLGIRVFADPAPPPKTQRYANGMSFTPFIPKLIRPGVSDPRSDNLFVMTRFNWEFLCREIVKMVENGTDVKAAYDTWLADELTMVREEANGPRGPESRHLLGP